ncbi:uncharacterized protein KY384_001906 [Bacidia gigantensis]|uniref:uncharacterized protein n=1 Tax=Bacidia gigantensis TaxID=2732470 RepID=UPI001D043979|nr:uncharacterized protein KY384_001906 [Bacidia gigantensis]KAG8533123.1 hypothetical protein KY384_001906 [Bacidia gigantensis]
MDFIKKAGDSLGGGENNQQQGQGGDQGKQEGGGGFLGGIGNKLNEAGGGGKESEKNEDGLDKGVDFVQEKFMGQGDQSNESAVEQAKDEKISDFIRDKYKSTTGSDVPIEDKPTKFS